MFLPQFDIQEYTRGRGSIYVKPDPRILAIKPYEASGLLYVAIRNNRKRNRPMYINTCLNCDGFYLASRIDSKTCSPRCRKRVSRWM